MKQKTALAQAIEKFEDAQKAIISKDKYADGYFGALEDCINVIKSLKLIERQQIEDFARDFAFNNPNDEVTNDFFDNQLTQD